MRNTNRLHACCVGCGFCGRAKSRFCIPELRACSALGVVDMTGAAARGTFKWMAPGFPRVGRAAPLSYLCVYNVVYLRLCCSQERRSASRQPPRILLLVRRMSRASLMIQSRHLQTSERHRRSHIPNRWLTCLPHPAPYSTKCPVPRKSIFSTPLCPLVLHFRPRQPPRLLAQNPLS